MRRARCGAVMSLLTAGRALSLTTLETSRSSSSRCSFKSLAWRLPVRRSSTVQTKETIQRVSSRATVALPRPLHSINGCNYYSSHTCALQRATPSRTFEGAIRTFGAHPSTAVSRLSSRHKGDDGDVKSSTKESLEPSGSAAGPPRQPPNIRTAWTSSGASIRDRGSGRAIPSGATRHGGRGSTGIRGMHDGSSSRPEMIKEIPEDQLQVSFSRSSGAGGQNVNKLSTKVEVRFVVADAEWLPHDVRVRLARHEVGRINNRGELVITSQEFRTQKQNRTAAMQKLREMIRQAWEPAKERKIRTGISKAGKEIRKADKRHRSQVKAGRSKLSSRDYD